MFSRFLLIFALCLSVTSCALFKPEVKTEYVYIEKPRLDIDKPTKPSIDTEVDWKVTDDGGVYTSLEEFKKFLKGLTDLGIYQKELQDIIDAYKNYYETK